MTSPQAPAGWYPDPSDDGVVRYWDGTSGPTLPRLPHSPCPSLSRRAAHHHPTPESVVRERTTPGGPRRHGRADRLPGRRHRDLRDEPGPRAGRTVRCQPADEGAVVKLIEAGRREYDAAEHDLQRDAALETRDESICEILGNGRVENWTGKVYEIDSDGDGQGILGINIEPNTQVTTRNGAFSGEDTLIPHGALLDRVTELETGQVVTFSGRFIPDDDGPCFTNPRLTQRQSIDRPLMVFRFRDVRRK